MPTGFFHLPVEVRLMIYDYLLVARDRPNIMVNRKHYPAGSFAPKQAPGLSPAILAVNKQIYSEASGVLYGQNRIRLMYQVQPDFCWNFSVVKDGDPGLTHELVNLAPDAAPFLSQIGHQAALLRHVTIMFPTLEIYDTYDAPLRGKTYDPLKPYKDYSRTFNLLRDACSNLKTLELVVSEDPDWVPSFMGLHSWLGIGSDNWAYPYHLDYLDRLFKEIVSLKEVLVHFQFYEHQKQAFQVSRWQKQINMFLERGWNYRFTELTHTDRSHRDDDDREYKTTVYSIWARSRASRPRLKWWRGVTKMEEEGG